LYIRYQEYSQYYDLRQDDCLYRLELNIYECLQVAEEVAEVDQVELNGVAEVDHQEAMVELCSSMQIHWQEHEQLNELGEYEEQGEMQQVLGQAEVAEVAEGIEE
jgi:hypothetical protein